ADPVPEGAVPPGVPAGGRPAGEDQLPHPPAGAAGGVRPADGEEPPGRRPRPPGDRGDHRRRAHGMNSLSALAIVFLITIAVIVLFFGLFVGGAVIVAVQAKWRGYSVWLWAAAGMLTFNPVIFLVMLALMPNRLRIQQRKQFRAELKRKLAAR